MLINVFEKHSCIKVKSQYSVLLICRRGNGEILDVPWVTDHSAMLWVCHLRPVPRTDTDFTRTGADECMLLTGIWNAVVIRSKSA